MSVSISPNGNGICFGVDAPQDKFRLGIDCIPDWFMDRVSTNEVILHGDRGDLRSAESKSRTWFKGDIISRFSFERAMRGA